ncbi:hypothetical protein BC832DRAFT_564642 [Gaertneriomyces semiglobifer]|nr:hypothetical protein BC832DRAFT_564642 [Gaertneriomyces semiglobifer]
MSSPSQTAFYYVSLLHHPPALLPHLSQPLQTRATFLDITEDHAAKVFQWDPTPDAFEFLSNWDAGVPRNDPRKEVYKLLDSETLLCAVPVASLSEATGDQRTWIVVLLSEGAGVRKWSWHDMKVVRSSFDEWCVADCWEDTENRARAVLVARQQEAAQRSEGMLPLEERSYWTLYDMAQAQDDEPENEKVTAESDDSVSIKGDDSEDDYWNAYDNAIK